MTRQARLGLIVLAGITAFVLFLFVGENFSMTVLPLRSPDIICEELIGRLYLTHQHSLAEFVSAMSEEQRASIALFCYAKTHLREIALGIAATCERAALIEAAGKIMGDILFTQSRERSAPVSPHSISRKAKITLATVASAVALASSFTSPATTAHTAAPTPSPGPTSSSSACRT
jgi:hypothetical protein